MSLTTMRLASGSVLGQRHRLAGKANQDAIATHVSVDLILGVVCDGCGSGPRSEVGAELGSRLLVGELEQQLNASTAGQHILQSGDVDMATKYIGLSLASAQTSVLARIADTALSLTTSVQQTIEEMFLFTALGVVMTPAVTVLFGVGDGYLVLNGDIQALGPFPGNAPPYLVYGGLVNSPYNGTEFVHLRPLLSLATAQVQSLLIATDGLEDYMDAHANGACIPNTTIPVPPVSALWSDVTLWSNPDWLRRQLAILNKRTGSLLSDDTSVLSIARLVEKGA